MPHPVRRRRNPRRRARKYQKIVNRLVPPAESLPLFATHTTPATKKTRRLYTAITAAQKPRRRRDFFFALHFALQSIQNGSGVCTCKTKSKRNKTPPITIAVANANRPIAVCQAARCYNELPTTGEIFATEPVRYAHYIFKEFREPGFKPD